MLEIIFIILLIVVANISKISLGLFGTYYVGELPLIGRFAVEEAHYNIMIVVLAGLFIAIIVKHTVIAQNENNKRK